MRRRAFLLGGIAAAAGTTAAAQTRGQIPRIGLLSIGASPTDPGNFVPFFEEMRALGYVEGQSITFERRFAAGRESLIPDYAADLVRQKVDVIVATGPRECVAAGNATKSIPIVMLINPDPIGLQLAASLAKPGGNVTGLTTMETAIYGKRLELLRQVAPGLTTASLFVSATNLTFHADTPWGHDRVAEAATLGIALDIVEATTAGEIEQSIQRKADSVTHALVFAADGDYVAQRTTIVGVVLKHKMPSMFGFRQDAEAGGLMAYAPVVADLSRRGAQYVDRILKGAKPADLPIEQPTRFELVINLRTARSLGLAIPPTLLAIADDVIE